MLLSYFCSIFSSYNGINVEILLKSESLCQQGFFGYGNSVAITLD